MLADHPDTAHRVESTGGVVLPSIIAVGYGIYLLLADDLHSTDGWILTILGLLSLFSMMASRKWHVAALTPLALGWYTFVVLGCLGLGIAISEGSEIRVMVSSVFWVLFGWYTLSRISRFRRMLNATRNGAAS